MSQYSQRSFIIHRIRETTQEQPHGGKQEGGEHIDLDTVSAIMNLGNLNLRKL